MPIYPAMWYAPAYGIQYHRFLMVGRSLNQRRKRFILIIPCISYLHSKNVTHYFIECFLRTAGYNGAEHGHGATFAARLRMVCSQSIMLQERKKEFFRRTLRMKNSVAASNISRGQLVSVHRRKIRLSGVSEMNLLISTSKP